MGQAPNNSVKLRSVGLIPVQKKKRVYFSLDETLKISNAIVTEINKLAG